MTRTLSSNYQNGLGWPPEVEPFDDDIDENGDWIAVPEIEVSLPDDDHDSDDQGWMRPRFYRLGRTPRLDVTRDVSAPFVADDVSPNGDQSLVRSEDELTQAPPTAEAVLRPKCDETLFADASDTPIECQQPPIHQLRPIHTVQPNLIAKPFKPFAYSHNEPRAAMSPPSMRSEHPRLERRPVAVPRRR